MRYARTNIVPSNRGVTVGKKVEQISINITTNIHLPLKAPNLAGSLLTLFQHLTVLKLRKLFPSPPPPLNLSEKLQLGK